MTWSIQLTAIEPLAMLLNVHREAARRKATHKYGNEDAVFSNYSTNERWGIGWRANLTLYCSPRYANASNGNHAYAPRFQHRLDFFLIMQTPESLQTSSFKSSQATPRWDLMRSTPSPYSEHNNRGLRCGTGHLQSLPRNVRIS